LHYSLESKKLRVTKSARSDIPSLKFFFTLNYKTSRVFRGLEQLSSSSFWRFMALYDMGVIYPRLAFVGVKIFTNFLFFSAIILAPDMLESQSRTLKTRMIV